VSNPIGQYYHNRIYLHNYAALKSKRQIKRNGPTGLIRYSRACDSYHDFFGKGLR
jgi:hypothetical protein